MNQFSNKHEYVSVVFERHWSPMTSVLHMVSLSSLNSTVIVTCDYVGNVTTLRTPRYSLTLTTPTLHLVPLCVINSTNESPFRLAIHFYYNDSSQLSLISDNSNLD